ncbi:MAG TPA: hypothetical protein VMW69_10105 [Spirochaetia bacterium]|nr:hypothetical protein [Spirochaetia bacterium]
MARATTSGAPREDIGISFEAAFGIFLDDGDRSALVDYLLSRSNLPGPRANLELLRRFSDTVAKECGTHQTELWDLCVSFVSIPQDKAFTGSPMEFIPMCGTVGFGAIGTCNAPRKNSYFAESMSRLKLIAGDPRWRVRESVAFALQRILESSKAMGVRTLSDWIGPGQWLQMRAVAAGIAETPLLKDPVLGKHALELHREILGHVVTFLEETHPVTLTEVMRSEPFRKLVQALEYSVSVVVAAYPEEGFPFLRDLATMAATRENEPELGKAASIVRKIVKGNLKKARLSKAYPTRVDELMRFLD